MSKKLIALAVCLILTATIVGCTDSSSSASGNSTSSDVSDSSAASDNSTQAKLVGKWEKGGQTNLDDPSAEEYADVCVYGKENGNYRYCEFYSNGTAVTSVYDLDGSVCKWEIGYNEFMESEELIVYSAVKQSEDADEYGFKVIKHSTILKLQKAYLKQVQPDENVQFSDLDTVTETLFMDFGLNTYFVKVDDSDFVDNPDLDENALKSIEAYKEKKGY